MDKTELLADALTKGIAYTENGGEPDIEHPKAGKTGEAKSIFQYTPDTWKHVAQQVYGNPDVPLTADTETNATKVRITKWIKEGKTIPQIASMWNAGEGEPDAYTGKFSTGTSSTGTNKKYGVKFDVPGYAKKVEDYTKQFLLDKHVSQPEISNPNTDPSNSPLHNLVAMIKETAGAAPKKDLPTTDISAVQTVINPAQKEPSDTDNDQQGLLQKALAKKQASKPTAQKKAKYLSHTKSMVHLK